MLSSRLPPSIYDILKIRFLVPLMEKKVNILIYGAGMIGSIIASQLERN